LCSKVIPIYLKSGQRPGSINFGSNKPFARIL